MKLKAILFALDKPATNGSIIPTKSFMEYLDSDDYLTRVKNGLMLGGVTHVDRYVENSGNVKGVAEWDPQLLNDCITHRIDRIYPDGSLVYADITFFDDMSQYSEKGKTTAMSILRLLKNGVKPPISMAIRGYWTNEDVCEKIVAIGGADFTLIPGFEDAIVTEVDEK